MADLTRFSISIDQELAARLDELTKQKGYTNRSEFVRDLVRDALVDEEWERNEMALGTITLVYDHNRRQLSDRLTGLQHEHHHLILATTHVHLDHDLCAEAILVKGRAGKIRELANLLRKQAGVLHGGLTMSSTGTRIR
jgi:CopG family transcriptional regulator, nickel-responsive regulator